MSESSPQHELHDVSAPASQEPAPEQLEQLAQRLAAETELDQASVETAIAVAFRQTYQGPIPSPQIVQRLNEIQPDLGTRIVEDHLEQQKHDRFIDMEQVSLAHKGSVRADRALVLQQWSTLHPSFYSSCSSPVRFILLFTGIQN